MSFKVIMKYIDIKKDYTKKDLSLIADIIKSGGIVIIPTDTVYGIAADAMNEDAVRRIYEIKGRDFSNPMNVLVSNLNMVKSVSKSMSGLEEEVIKEFFPGAITIILEKNSLVPNIVTAGNKTIGIRMPKNEFILKLIEEVQRPIVATSCNLAGNNAMIYIDEIMRVFGDKVEAIVDEGKSKIGIPSTVIKVEENSIKILREGPIKMNTIVQKVNKKG